MTFDKIIKIKITGSNINNYLKRVIKRKSKKMIRNIRGCLWGGFLVVLIFRGVMVDAGINDSHIEKNKVEGVYAVTNFMGSDHLYYLNIKDLQFLKWLNLEEN